MKTDSYILNFEDIGHEGLSTKFFCHFPPRYVRKVRSKFGNAIVIGRTFYGPDAELDGNYALIHRTDDGIIEIDRDLFGSIPLFYSLKRGLISTDLRDLLPDSGMKWSSDGACEYLSCAFISLGQTIYEDIFVLRPDEKLFILDNNLFVGRKKIFHPETIVPFVGDLTKELKNAIQRSICNLSDEIEKQCILNLSGGNDSTLILAMLREERNDLEIFSNTFFHVDWRHDEFDDWKYAEQAAKKYKTHHHLVNISNKKFEAAHNELVKSGKNVFHTYAAAFYLQNKELEKSVHHNAPIINGSGPDETMIGTEKIPVNRLMSMNKMAQNEWIKYTHDAKDYNKLPETEANFLLKIQGGSFLGRRHKLALELLGTVDSFVDFQRRFHSMLILQDHIIELSQVSAILGRPIFFPFLTNEIFRIIFGAKFKDLNRNFVYKAVIKDILSQFMEKNFVYRKKIGFQSPSRQYFLAPDGLGCEVHRLLNKKDSSILSIENAKTAVLERLKDEFSPIKRYDFVEWAVFNMLRLDEINEKKT